MVLITKLCVYRFWLCPRYHPVGPPPPPQKCAKLVSHKIRVGGVPPPPQKCAKLISWDSAEYEGADNSRDLGTAE